MSNKFIISLIISVFFVMLFSTSCQNHKDPKIIIEQDSLKKIIEEQDSLRILKTDSLVKE